MVDARGPKDDRWSPDPAAVSTERLLDEDGASRVAMLRHPTHPYAVDVADGPDLDARLLDVANDYIRLIHDKAELGRAADLLLAGFPDGFGWLQLAWGGAGGDRDPGLSFWVTGRDRQRGVKDRSAVLLAGNRHVSDGAQRCERAGVGLRIVMHLTPVDDGSGRLLVRIGGAIFWRLQHAREPNLGDLIQVGALKSAQQRAQQVFGFGRASITGFAVIPSPGSSVTALRLIGVGGRGSGSAERVFSWTARLNRSAVDGESSVVPESLVEQSSNMAADTMVFAADPASRKSAATEVLRRPSRDATRLDPFRSWTFPLPAVLKDPAGRFEVHQSVVGDRDNDPDQAQVLPAAPKLPLRSDHLAAAHAAARASELFERLDAYGLPAETYFKEAELPLVLRHRAWFYSQPDGLTINAEVRYSAERHGLAEPGPTGERPRLEVRFGSANLTHRDERRNDHGRKRSQPLGLAADPRWAWHEFGHVLSFAGTGALEFPFAHSAGDGLAAIVADPDSRLARATAAGSSRAGMSGYTFPWAQLSRRHDRSAAEGWCWCGRRNGARHARPRLPPLLFKGYTEEQMLASSLFMLYRAIGGDAWGSGASGASPRRHAASDYVVYLVMRAIALLGPSSITPASSPDIFVSALIDADIGTADWLVTATWRACMPRDEHRIGGTVHKVIRWAFEQQGLYATPDPKENVEGPGKPPDVDIHVPGLDGRSTGEYAPVPLTWTSDPNALAPGWFAHPSALWPADGQVHMTVRNRGEQAANGIAVRAWVTPADDLSAWTLLWQTGPSPASVGGGGAATFHFEAKDAGGLALRGAWFVLGEASCLDDRSNLDPAALLACSGATPPVDAALLTDLVANDNNLGLRLIDFG